MKILFATFCALSILSSVEAWADFVCTGMYSDNILVASNSPECPITFSERVTNKSTNPDPYYKAHIHSEYVFHLERTMFKTDIDTLQDSVERCAYINLAGTNPVKGECVPKN